MSEPNSDSQPRKATLTELQAWLQAAASSPKKGPRLQAMLVEESTRLIPPLIYLATRHSTKICRLAVKALTEVVMKAESGKLLHEILTLLPDKSVEIAGIGVIVTKKLLSFLPEGQRLASAEAAQLWNNLSERHQDANQIDEAFLCAETAVQACLGLSLENSLHRRLLVQCLLTRCKRHAERRRKVKALSDVDEAWSVASFTAESSPEDRLVAARTVTLRANRLADMGAWEDAIKAVQLAATLLAGHPNADNLTEDRAGLELSWANSLTRLGRQEEALPHSDMADRLFRVLSGHSPDQYLEFSAAAAAVYAQNLQHTGNLQLSYDLSRENVERLRILTARQPERFGREFAAHLINLSDSAGELGRHQEAVTFGSDAVKEIRKAGKRSGQLDYYLEGLAWANLFNRHYPRREFAEAEKAARSAIRAFGRLPLSDPESVPERARSLRNLAELQRVTAAPGKEARAVKTAMEALLCLDVIEGEKSEAILVMEAHCRSTLASCLEADGQLQEAIAEERRSIVLREDLFSRSRLQYRTDLAYSQLQLARQLLAANRPAEAFPVIKEVVHHYEIAKPTSPQSYVAFHAQALRIQGDVEVAMGRTDEGKATLEQAIRLLIPYHEKSPADCFNTLAPICDRYREVFRLTEGDATAILPI